jgi:hypothetical protein
MLNGHERNTVRMLGMAVQRLREQVRIEAVNILDRGLD